MDMNERVIQYYPNNVCVENKDDLKFQGDLFSNNSLQFTLAVGICDSKITPGKCESEDEIKRFLKSNSFYFVH